jgi:DNA topoisomerase-2
MKISDFLNKEVVDFASYSTIRAIPSLVDGLKNSGRKVASTIQTRKQLETKVSILAGIIAVETEYLHGDISGSIVSMAKNFTGTNNLPLLTREGNFGTRYEPEASAGRYIFTGKEEIFDKLFIKEDNDIIIQQEFEGTIIEPKFFVPTLPMIAINGGEGIATGFASKILPRNPELVKQYLKNKLIGKKVPELLPWYSGFTGEIEKGEKPNQYIIKGTVKRENSFNILITELPIGYNLTSYTKILDDLEEKKIIKGYDDLSENDRFKFRLRVQSSFSKTEKGMLDKLKLIKKVTENFTVVNEDNKIIVCNSIYEIIDKYIEVKKLFMIKRKEFMLSKIENNLNDLNSKYIFIENIQNGKIIVNKKSKDEIISQIKLIDEIKENDSEYDYLLRMPIYSLTIEKLDELKNEIIEKDNIYKKLYETSEIKLWENDVDNILFTKEKIKSPSKIENKKTKIENKKVKMSSAKDLF